jgi:hypothetical protein
MYNDKKYNFIIGVSILMFLIGSSSSVALIYSNTANASKSTTSQTTTPSSQPQKLVEQSAKIQASGTANDIGKQLVDKLNKIVQTPGVQPSSIKISCTVSYPPLVITCTISWLAGSEGNLNSSKSNIE